MTLLIIVIVAYAVTIGIAMHFWTKSIDYRDQRNSARTAHREMVKAADQWVVTLNESYPMSMKQTKGLAETIKWYRRWTKDYL